MSDTLTYTQVRDFVYQKIVKILRSSDANEILGYTPYIKWPGIEPEYQEGSEAVEQDGKINNNLHWLRVQIKPVENKRFGHIKTVHNETGLLSIEWFSPKSKAEAYDEMEKINQLLKNSFIGKRLYASLYFKSGLSTPLDPTENSYRFKTTIEYNYLEAAI